MIENLRSGSCAARTRYDLLVRQNPSILDEGPISADCVKRHLKKGQFVVIAAPGGPRKSKVLWINKTSFRTEHDLYYFYEHRKLWWFTERGAAIEKQIWRRVRRMPLLQAIVGNAPGT